jgi:hypothetical protein
MKENDKRQFTTFSGQFFWKLYDYISQNWGSDNHFEVLNRSKPWLIQKLWLKMQIFPFPFFCDIVEKNAFMIFVFLYSFGLLCHNCCTNHDSDLLSTSKWLSESQFCKRFSYSWHKNNQQWSYSGHLSDANFDDQSLIQPRSCAASGYILCHNF